MTPFFDELEETPNRSEKTRTEPAFDEGYGREEEIEHEATQTWRYDRSY